MLSREELMQWAKDNAPVDVRNTILVMARDILLYQRELTKVNKLLEQSYKMRPVLDDGIGPGSAEVNGNWMGD